MGAQDEYLSPNRAQQVWSHFCGLFGADALKRKFGPTPPAQWEAQLAYLTDAQIRRGFQVTMNAGSAHVPTLPEFVHACRSAREFEAGDLSQVTGPLQDKWGVEANSHLLAFMMDRVMKRRPIPEGGAAVLIQFKNAWAEDMRADDKGEGVPIEKQRAAWQDCMERAAEQIGAADQAKAA